MAAGSGYVLAKVRKLKPAAGMVAFASKASYSACIVLCAKNVMALRRRTRRRLTVATTPCA